MGQKESRSRLPLKGIIGKQAFLKLLKKGKYNWFSLFMVTIFYQVTENPETLGAPRRNRGLDSCKPLITVFSSTNQYKTLFYVCFSFKDTFLNVYC